MFLLDWYKQWLDIRKSAREEEKPCESCETLKQQLEIANYEKEKLLNRIMEKPEPERTTAPEPQAVRPKMVPWHVRRQMLEREDRERARLMREAPKTDKEIAETAKTDVAELEKEMDIASAEREKQTAG